MTLQTGLRQQNEDPQDYKDKIIDVQMKIDELKKKKASILKANEVQRKQMEELEAEFNYEGQIADLKKAITDQRVKYHANKKKQQANHRSYGQTENAYADKLSQVESARLKVKLDKLNVAQAKREQRLEQSMGMTSKIFGTMSRFNPSFDNQAKIPFGSEKGRIGEMHERLKTIDANQIGGFGGSPREKAL